MSGDAVKAAIVVGAIAAFPVAAGWTAGFSIGALSPALSTFIVTAASSLVLSTVNQKLAPSLDLPDIGTSLASNTTLTVKEPTQAHRIVYGTTRIGGNIVFAETTDNNQYLHLVIAFTGHTITSFSKVYFGEDEVSLITDGADANGLDRFVPASASPYEGKARIKKHLGATNQAADADLVSEVAQWTSDHRLRGRSYLYVRLDFDSDVYPNGVPNITAEVEGKELFDPRDSSTSFSSNPALCIRDFLTNADYGMKAEASEIDDTNFIAVANTCEESVSLTSGSENRFTMNGTFQVDQTPKSILQNMLSSIGGHIVYSNGKFKLVAATFKTPTITLDESNLRSGLTVNTRVSKKELFNAVKGIYSEPANKYQPQDYPVLTNATFETEDNNERNYAEFNFPFTTSSTTCQRLSKIQLLKARQQITLVATFDLSAFELNVGDTVRITNSRMGFSSKTFEVSNWNLSLQSSNDGSPAIVVNCELRETASAVYDFSTIDYSTISSGKATNLTSATQVTPPSAITLTDELVQYNDGTVLTKLVIVVTAPSDTFTEQFEVEVKQDTDANGIAVTDQFKLIGRGTRLRYEFLNVIDAATYSVRVRSVNIFGVKSSTLTASREIIGSTAIPADVEDFNISMVGSNQMQLSWTPVEDLDIEFYEIRYSLGATPTLWFNTTNLVQVPRRKSNSVAINAIQPPYNLYIKAVDKLGNESAEPAIISSNVTRLESFEDISQIVEEPTFLGTYNNTFLGADSNGVPAVTLDTISLFDSTPGNFEDPDALGFTFDTGGVASNISSSGDYIFTNSFSLDAVYDATFRAEITMQSDDPYDLFDLGRGASLFDDAKGPFDGTAPSNNSAILQVGSSDASLGSITTFTSIAQQSTFKGRFFKFKLILKSNNNQAKALVTGLRIRLVLEKRTENGEDIASGVTTKTITFVNNFYQPPVIIVTGQDLATGDFYVISNKSKTGFDILFKDSTNANINRTFDFQAIGYGLQT